MNVSYTCSFCDEALHSTPGHIHTWQDPAGKLEQRITCNSCIEIIGRYKKILAATAGRVSTKKKARSSRRNGKLGGRPRLNKSGLADVVIFLLFTALTVGAVVAKDSNGNNIVSEVIEPQPTPVPVRIVE